MTRTATKPPPPPRARPLLETPQRAQHAAAIIDRNIGSAIGLPGRYVQSPLDRLAARGRVSPRMHSAAVRLRDDFDLGMLGARDVSSESLGIRNGFSPASVSERQIAAMRAYASALKTIGPYVGAILVAVCCYERDVQAIAVEQRRNRTEVIGVLKDGLKTLADHYRMTGQD